TPGESTTIVTQCPKVTGWVSDWPLARRVAHSNGNQATRETGCSCLGESRGRLSQRLNKAPGMATFLIGGISLTPELVNLFFGDSTCIGDRGEPDARELRSRRAPPLLLRS